MTTEKMTQALDRVNQVPMLPDVIEQALAQGDISKMPAAQQVAYYKAVCMTAGLNPLTRPFEALKGQDGTYKLYARKEAAEQLRKLHNVSVRTVSRENIDGIYIVTVEASMPNGRREEAQGIVPLTKTKKVQQGKWPSGDPKFAPVLDENGDEVLIPLKGEELARAMMRAETKAKRRVTLAICGLGFSEAGDNDYIDVTPVEHEPLYHGTVEEAYANISGDDSGMPEVQYHSAPRARECEPESNPFAPGGEYEHITPPVQPKSEDATTLRLIDSVTDMYERIRQMAKTHAGDKQPMPYASYLLQSIFGEDYNSRGHIKLAIEEMDEGSVNPSLYIHCAIAMGNDGLPGIDAKTSDQWKEKMDAFCADQTRKYMESHMAKVSQVGVEA